MNRVRRKLRLVDAATGIVLCALAAALASFVLPVFMQRSVVPLVFTAVLITISRYYGTLVGFAGALCATAIFSYFLFAPVGTWEVASSQAKANVAWMMLI